MSRDALRDAFVAGWVACSERRSSMLGPVATFDAWYQKSLNTLDRSPTIIGVDLAAPGSDIGVTYLVYPDGRSVPLDDDGWIAWDGSKDYPIDVSASTIVDIRMRGGCIILGNRAGIWMWRFRQANADANIVAYRVVKP